MKNLLYPICTLATLLWGSAGMQAAWAAHKIPLPETGQKTLLHEGWQAKRANEILIDGNTLTARPAETGGWMPARVPGTVLTTMLENGLYEAPEFSMNNQLIPDIYHVGNDFYTFWFRNEFETGKIPEGKRLWLNFRGINYKADVFLNGKRLNNSTLEGMFLRNSFDITPYVREDRPNVLAVIVHPPDFPGNPNGGQGGDGQIARNVTMQYTPGWDWIQPVRDRNTGIWDEVSLTLTGDVRIGNPYVVTKVPGKREVGNSQKDAIVRTTVELENLTRTQTQGMLIVSSNGTELKQQVILAPGEKKEVALRDLTIRNPRLWWPNGIGPAELYDMEIRFEAGGSVSDSHRLRYGIREIVTEKDPVTGGRKFYVNGQPIYMTGGNYINSDWLLRLSPERYRAEVRFHAEMNLRMIRVWGGALLERPEFYDACDEYGMLVFQDLWGSGDCNGAWQDAMKTHSRERRMEYPDNHSLFLTCVEDQVKMVRNHPSLCMWCGANEWPLARDIDEVLRLDLMPRIDPERLFASYSTDDEFTANILRDNGDGPYGIQEPEWFFTFRSHPFNPEAGSVGSPEVESMRAIMTERELRMFPRPNMNRRFSASSSWGYHKDLGYGDHLERYGDVRSIEDYCKYAQIVNYDQYRSFMEGWATHMWDWYTGILIWKTQNPWTALRGQMYDWFLDVNASLYGTRKGCEPLHPLYNPVTRGVEMLNTSLRGHSALTVLARVYSPEGKVLWEHRQTTDSPANTVNALFEVPAPAGIEGVYFLKLALLDGEKELTDNIYWLTTREKDYRSLSELPRNRPAITADLHAAPEGKYSIPVTLREQQGNISFFNRIKVFDKATGERILPVHYSDNYVSLMPGEQKTIQVEFESLLKPDQIRIVAESWTSDPVTVL